MFLEIMRITLFIIIGAVAATYLMIIVHECGHLICGRLSGYTFVSFTILGRTIYKQGDRLKIKKFAIKGTAGQCLMAPPDYTPDYPYKLYNYGGALANLIAATVFALPAVLLDIGYFPRILFAIFMAVNLMGALENGIPLTIGGIPNDGKNAQYAGKDENARKAFYQQLYAAHFLSEHEYFTDLLHEEIAVEPTADLSNFLTGNAKMFEAQWLIEGGDIAEGLAQMQELEPYIEQYPDYYKHNFINELVYNYIQYDHEPNMVEQFLDKNHQKYCKKMLVQNFDLAAAAVSFLQGNIEQGTAALEKAGALIAMIPQIGIYQQAKAQISRLEHKYVPLQQ